MKSYTDLMIDLETLSTKNDAVILEIGWAFFNRHDDRSMFTRGWFPDLDEQTEMGFRIDHSTMQWWTEQPRAYKNQMDANRQSVNECVEEMIDVWYSAATEDTNVWAKGTTFDITILKKIMAEPWGFRNIHDLRTLKLAGEIRGIQVSVRNEFPHSASHDAEAQAKEVQALCSTIRGE